MCALQALAVKEADAYMWEKFTTKPHVDRNTPLSRMP